MMKAPLPAYERERLDALQELQILDTDEEEVYNDITLIATQIAQAPIAAISLVDRDRQWFKSIVGLDCKETDRDVSFCAHAILTPYEPLIVNNALQDNRFVDNPLVLRNPNIRFYLGAPLVTRHGMPLGALCVIDRIPRQLTTDQIRGIISLSRLAIMQLEPRKKVNLGNA